MMYFSAILLAQLNVIVHITFGDLNIPQQKISWLGNSF